MNVLLALLLLAAIVYFAGPDLLRLARAVADWLPLVRVVPLRLWKAVGIALAVFVGVFALLALAWGGRDLDEAFACALVLAVLAGTGYLIGPGLWRWARANPRTALRLLGILFAVVAFVFFLVSLDRGNEEAVIGLLIFGSSDFFVGGR